MSWIKKITLISFVVFAFNVSMLDCALAGEKIKLHGSSLITEWHQMEVGDKEGHVMAVYKAKQIYINEINNEKFTSSDVSTIDLNLKTGQGSLKGYGVNEYVNGDITTRKYEGKSEGKGHWKGSWTFVRGTGKYEGVKGGGTWDSYSMGQGKPSYMEVEGEMELPSE